MVHVEEERVMTYVMRALVAVGVPVVAVMLLGVAPVAGQSDEVTFSRDVAPIFQRSCQGCHRPGQMGPMS